MSRTRLPEGDRPLTPQEVAEFFTTTVGTLRQWRYQGRGPKAKKVEGLVRYDVAEVLRYWYEDCT